MASKTAQEKNKEKGVSFKDTLNLPQTEFPIHANAKVDDPAMVERWEHIGLFRDSFEHNKGNEKFILHDGPPYANGHIHVGHAYNKVSKDIVTKSQRMAGKHVPVTPGWDCHGLPIELKVTKEKPGLAPQELKKECRAYAQGWIDIQRQEFKNLGILMDWDRPYYTMNPAYEAAILRSFGAFVADGYIERKNKTVSWCASCQTVLASAEIEYEDRKDPSIYVRFPFEPAFVQQMWPEFGDKEVSLLVWTTTPWTIPLNRAVAIRPETPYTVLDMKG
jgi:isoleucyl-tRNA synthetase